MEKYCFRLPYFKICVILFLTFLSGTFCVLPNFEPLLINCGGSAYTDDQGSLWAADVGFQAGESKTISNASSYNLSSQDAVLRYFYPRDLSCYHINVPVGRYLIQSGFAYRNIDNLSTPPELSFYVEGVLVHQIALGDWEAENFGVLYKESIAYVRDGTASICLLPSKGRALISSLQIFPQDDFAYNGSTLSQTSFLSTHIRINCGGSSLGPSLYTGYRLWMQDTASLSNSFEHIHTEETIVGVDEPPDYLPAGIFQSGLEAGPSTVISYSYYFQGLSNLNDWLVRLYFAEIKADVKVGERVFDIRVNSHRLDNFDILKNTSNLPFVPTSLMIMSDLTLPSYTTPANIIISLSKSENSLYNPLISAFEVFEVLPAGPAIRDVEAELIGRPSANEGLTAGAVAAICLAALGGVVAVGGVAGCAIMWRSERTMRADRGREREEWGEEWVDDLLEDWRDDWEEDEVEEGDLEEGEGEGRDRREERGEGESTEGDGGGRRDGGREAEGVEEVEIRAEGEGSGSGSGRNEGRRGGRGGRGRGRRRRVDMEEGYYLERSESQRPLVVTEEQSNPVPTERWRPRLEGSPLP